MTNPFASPKIPNPLLRSEMWAAFFFALLTLVQSNDLHCCFAPRDRPVVLACDQYQEDLIAQVPFAYFAPDEVVPFEERLCGADVDGMPDSPGIHIQNHLSSTCVGQRRCEVQWSDFAHLCSSCTELHVRWVCKSDEKQRRRLSTSAAFVGPLHASGSQLLDSQGKQLLQFEVATSVK